MLTRDYDINLGISLAIGFILFTVLGTITHELGHFTFAKLLGHEASISYNKTHWIDDTDLHRFDSIYDRYSSEIAKGVEYPAKKEFEDMIMKSSRDSLLISLGGPLQTMLSGTIGVLMLLRYRKYFSASTKLNFKQWLIIFISLFWLRQIFNFIHSLFVFLLKGYFPSRNDEVKISVELGINKLSITSSTALIAIIILCLALKFIPIRQRLTFLISGLIGGIIGFYVWFYLVGPIVMP